MPRAIHVGLAAVIKRAARTGRADDSERAALKRRIAFACVCLLLLSARSAVGEQAFQRNLNEDDWALRGVDWTERAEDVAEKESGEVTEDGNVVVEAPEIYKLEALRLTYLYEDGEMVRRSFRLPKDVRYYACAFYSLMMRYGVPQYTEDYGDTCWWFLEDARIELCITNYTFVIFHREMPEPSEAEPLPEPELIE